MMANKCDEFTGDPNDVHDVCRWLVDSGRVKRPDCTCSEPDYQDQFCPQHGQEATATPKPCICDHLAYWHTEMIGTKALALRGVPCTAAGCQCPEYMPNYLT